MVRLPWPLHVKQCVVAIARGHSMHWYSIVLTRLHETLYSVIAISLYYCSNTWSSYIIILDLLLQPEMINLTCMLHAMWHVAKSDNSLMTVSTPYLVTYMCHSHTKLWFHMLSLVVSNSESWTFHRVSLLPFSDVLNI